MICLKSRDILSYVHEWEHLRYLSHLHRYRWKGRWLGEVDEQTKEERPGIDHHIDLALRVQDLSRRSKRKELRVSFHSWEFSVICSFDVIRCRFDVERSHHLMSFSPASSRKSKTTQCFILI